VVEFNSSTTFREQVETMAGTGVYISVHTSNLANAQFLAPGSAVVELIQKNWIWHNLDQSFKVGWLCGPGRGTAGNFWFYLYWSAWCTWLVA
jgi:hypothetical protein